MYDLGYDIHQNSFQGPLVTRAQLRNWTEPNIVNYYMILRKTQP